MRQDGPIQDQIKKVKAGNIAAQKAAKQPKRRIKERYSDSEESNEHELGDFNVIQRYKKEKPMVIKKAMIQMVREKPKPQPKVVIEEPVIMNMPQVTKVQKLVVQKKRKPKEEEKKKVVEKV